MCHRWQEHNWWFIAVLLLLSLFPKKCRNLPYATGTRLLIWLPRWGRVFRPCPWWVARLDRRKSRFKFCRQSASIPSRRSSVTIPLFRWLPPAACPQRQSHPRRPFLATIFSCIQRSSILCLSNWPQLRSALFSTRNNLHFNGCFTLWCYIFLCDDESSEACVGEVEARLSHEMCIIWWYFILHHGVCSLEIVSEFLTLAHHNSHIFCIRTKRKHI